MNANIIATTLVPFPDENLSSLQLQFVQKRNNFIVKHKQTNHESSQLITNLEDQIREIKILY